MEGYDAAAKAAILASIAFHTRVTADDVHREGITKISPADFATARALGCTIKLLSICERITTDDGRQRVSARVYPALVPLSHPLATVNGAFNAVVVEAEAAGRLMFYGQGAGGAPTASAVTGDLVMAARNRVLGSRGPKESKYAQLPIAPMGFISTRYYVSMNVADTPGRIVLGGSRIRQARGEHRRGPPGGRGRTRAADGWAPASSSSPTTPPTPRCPKPLRRSPTWMSCTMSQACCAWKEPTNERATVWPFINRGPG